MGETERPPKTSLRRAIQRVSERGAYGWVRLVVLLLCGIAGGVLLGLAAPEIVMLLFRAFGQQKDPVAAHSPISTTGLVVLGIFIGMFLGAFVLNSLAKLADSWEKMPSGEKVNIFIGVFGGFIVALTFLTLFSSLGLQTVYVPFLTLGLTL